MNTWIQRLLEVPYTDTTPSSAMSSKVNANTTEKERAKLNCWLLGYVYANSDNSTLFL